MFTFNTALDATKRCTRCSVMKPVFMYGKHPRNKDGLQSHCKPCRAATQREGRAAKNTANPKFKPRPRKVYADTDTHKHCRKCEELKPREAFNKAKTKKDGICSYCSDCDKASSRESYCRRKAYKPYANVEANL